MRLLLIGAAAFMAFTQMGCSSAGKETVALKDHFKNDFLVGCAIPTSQLNGRDPKADSVVSLHFNSIVAENCMKHEKLVPHEGAYFWDDADKFVKFGEERGMAIVGHTLVWHSQLAPWFPYDSEGKYVSADVLKARMRDYIHTVVGRYKGRVKTWEVVNEAIEDDGSYRKTPFYEILGEEYIPLAFEYAHEADPEAELYINDFSMFVPGKRDAYVKIVNDLKKRGLRIDAVGMQTHIGMDYPDFKEYEKSIVAFGATGCKVMVTELEMSALPTVQWGANISDNVELQEKYNPYTGGLPEEVSKEWNDRMAMLMDIYKRNSDIVARVTWWGTQDGMSWKNDFPMRGRTDYPLLFDRNYNMKPFMVKELASSKN